MTLGASVIFCQKQKSVIGLLTHLTFPFQAPSEGSGEACGRPFTSIPQGRKPWAEASPGRSEVHFSPDTNIAPFHLLGTGSASDWAQKGQSPLLTLRVLRKIMQPFP